MYKNTNGIKTPYRRFHFKLHWAEATMLAANNNGVKTPTIVVTGSTI